MYVRLGRLRFFELERVLLSAFKFSDQRSPTQSRGNGYSEHYEWMFILFSQIILLPTTSINFLMTSRKP